MDDYYDSTSSYRVLTDVIKKFIKEFYTFIVNKDLIEIENLYKYEYPKLTEKYFKNTRWPAAEVIAPLVNDDKIFLILYKEMYYRHIVAHINSGPTIQERFESYYNYLDLFKEILETETPIDLHLPDQWLWDIVDELIYQYQSFTQFCCKLKHRSEEEIDILRNNPRIWNIHSVFNVLYTFVEKSNINEQLRMFSSAGRVDVTATAGQFGSIYLYKMLGFFSLIGLCRLHCLFGDYAQALRALEHVDIGQQELYSKVHTCHITTLYYMGFCHLMMRQYPAAIHTFTSCVFYANKIRARLQYRPDVQDYVTKQVDQMFVLLAICLILYPMRIDDSIHQTLYDKYADKMNKMSRMDINEFSNSFIFSCPKFVSPIPPDYNKPVENYHLIAQEHQHDMFIKEIQKQEKIQKIRSYLKLYTTMDISKLANFLDTSKEDLYKDLICYKQKIAALQNENLFKSATNNTAESGENGETVDLQLQQTSSSDIDFYIDGEMIHIGDAKQKTNYGEFFVTQIHQFQQINETLKSMSELKS